MGDVLRAEEIETCKENIQPLREGRRASTLKKIVTVTKSVEDIEKERQYALSRRGIGAFPIRKRSFSSISCFPDNKTSTNLNFATHSGASKFASRITSEMTL